MRLLPNSRSRRTTLQEETTEAYPPSPLKSMSCPFYGRFEVGESTHHRMMYRVMDFLLDIAPRIVTFPDDMEKLSNKFKQGLADELKFVFVHLAALLAFMNALSSPRLISFSFSSSSLRTARSPLIARIW
ncbi:hypothetical protein MRX96_015922 [Rhipicephalus microplus]